MAMTNSKFNGKIKNQGQIQWQWQIQKSMANSKINGNDKKQIENSMNEEIPITHYH